MLQVGIDIGSTTIKTVVLSTTLEIIYKSYERHLSEINKFLARALTELRRVVGEEPFTFALTGSAGMGIAERLNLPFVQEVIACASAVKRLIPQTDTAIELGGEDAKITYFGAAPEQRMNGTCAGGTGSFIDHMASLLSTDAAGLNALAAKGKEIYTIASRCGVFAKTDIQALMNDGVGREDIALSVLQAVVNQTIGNLAQGRPIAGRVAFLGGPLSFLPVLKERFIATLDLAPEQVVPVTEGPYFVAEGAALSEERKVLTIDVLSASAAQAASVQGSAKRGGMVLFQDAQELDTFRKRHAQHQVKRAALATYTGPVYVGIDAGSTTTKMAVVGADHSLLYSAYQSNQGAPLKVVVEQLKTLYSQLPEGAYIATVLTTGYGEALVKTAIHADYGEVETMAHLRAARELEPEVSCVLDIGGQDMKCFLIRRGNIEKITLNEACSAGCGSFIENFAQGLKLSVGEFAAEGLLAQDPVDLGTRCTVFMNSRVKQAQKEGASVGDIAAGIALSVVKNALYKVMQLRDTKTLGQHIVVQGGTFYNDGVLRAAEKLLGQDLVRPDIAGLMGAYGAALLAKEKELTLSGVLSLAQLDAFAVTSTSYRCQGCGNHCRVTMQRFADGSKFFTGNRCERGEGKSVPEHKAPNIYAYKYQRLFEYYKPLTQAPRGKIGLLRVLNMYEDYPFWFTFLTEVGYEVVLSGKSSPELFAKGMATVPSDSLCYPAKLAHGHVMDLLERGVKKIFYPCVPYNMKDGANKSDNNFNCPVVASYGENLRNNVDALQDKGVEFIEPFLPLNDKKHLIHRLREVFGQDGVSASEIARAVALAYTEIEHYREDVRSFGQKILRDLEQGKYARAVVLAGRPYHIDPEINHGIPELIQSYGLPVLSEDALYHELVASESLDIVNQWSYHARLYHAASYVAAHEKLVLIQLNSFGCGLDAITTDEVRRILELHERIYTLIKLDEVSNVGAFRIRLRTLLAALAQRTEAPYEVVAPQERAHFTAKDKKVDTIIAPQMAPIHFDLISCALRKHGYKVVVPEMTDRSAVDVGLRYVNNDMCYPAVLTIGQMLALVEQGKCNPNKTAVMMFQTCGACRATNYLNLARRAFREAGYSQIPIFACYGREQDEFNLSLTCFEDIMKALVYGDLLMRVLNRIRPYEKVKGAAQKLYESCMTKCRKEIESGNFFKFLSTVRAVVQDFDKVEIDEKLRKPRVGIVGEILTKYHAVANNNLEQVLADEGAEVVMPDLIDFLLYLAYDNIARFKLLDGGLPAKMASEFFIKVVEFFRHPMAKALEASRRFTPPVSIKKLAAMAAEHVSLGNMAGEGWFLTGEMVELIRSGTPNVVCLQPFACLPNHITGKGVFREMRRAYPECNLVALDCDAGVSEVNQLNRLKLMLAVARENLAKI